MINENITQQNSKIRDLIVIHWYKCYTLIFKKKQSRPTEHNLELRI